VLPICRPAILLAALAACNPSDDTDPDDSGSAGDSDTASPRDTEDTGDTGADADSDTDDTDVPGPVVDAIVANVGTVPGPTDLCAYDDDLTVSCGDGPEWVTRFTAPWDGTFLFRPSGTDLNLTLSVHDDDEATTELECARTASDPFDTDEAFTADDALVASLGEGESVLVGLGQDDCLDNDLVIRGRPDCLPEAIDTLGLFLGFDEDLDDLGNGVVTPDGDPPTTVEAFAGNTQVPGVYGKALGEGTCVTVSHDETLWPGQMTGDTAFTWSVWFKADEPPDDGDVGILMELRDCVYDCPDGPNKDTTLLRLFMADDGTVRAFTRQQNFSNQFTLSSTASYADGAWHHVVLTRGVSSLVGNDFFLYVDGAKVDELNRADNSVSDVQPGDEPLSIGCGLTQNTATPTADFGFPGVIDSVAVFPDRMYTNPIVAWNTCVTDAQLP